MTDWGRNDLMATCAVRYCLGRMSYIVGDCVEWLLRVWPDLSPEAQSIIRDDVDRAWLGTSLGMDMDRRDWSRVRDLWTQPTDTKP